MAKGRFKANQASFQNAFKDHMPNNKRFRSSDMVDQRGTDPLRVRVALPPSPLKPPRPPPVQRLPTPEVEPMKVSEADAEEPANDETEDQINDDTEESDEKLLEEYFTRRSAVLADYKDKTK
ncbi:hypothetical protein V5O48_017972 [Marasmius crinis-equi]|uniref:Uncharacterized protein n=1 Tax=Marasmius crinis-equi TaxID=585013 RepID=A0ABR3EMH4_9AGAR